MGGEQEEIQFDFEKSHCHDVRKTLSSTEERLDRLKRVGIFVVQVWEVASPQLYLGLLADVAHQFKKS